MVTKGGGDEKNLQKEQEDEEYYDHMAMEDVSAWHRNIF